MQVLNVVKNSLSFNLSQENTLVYVLSIHKDQNENSTKNIGCKIGEPIGGYVYDVTTDSCYFNCYDFISLGVVPVSVKVSFNDWSCFAPLPDKIIKKHLDKNQKKILKNFLSKFDESYSIRYLQMIDINS